MASGPKTAFQRQAIMILLKIADADYLTTPQLIKETGMLRSNISGFLTKLRKKKFVVTRSGWKDKRKKYHYLTPVGREHLDNLSG